MILPKRRDPRFIIVRRGDTLTDVDHRLLALWAAASAALAASLRAKSPRQHSPRQAAEGTRTIAGEARRTAKLHSPAWVAYAAVREVDDPADQRRLAVTESGNERMTR